MKNGKIIVIKGLYNNFLSIMTITQILLKNNKNRRGKMRFFLSGGGMDALLWMERDS